MRRGFVAAVGFLLLAAGCSVLAPGVRRRLPSAEALVFEITRDSRTFREHIQSLGERLIDPLDRYGGAHARPDSRIYATLYALGQKDGGRRIELRAFDNWESVNVAAARDGQLNAVLMPDGSVKDRFGVLTEFDIHAVLPARGVRLMRGYGWTEKFNSTLDLATVFPAAPGSQAPLIRALEVDFRYAGLSRHLGRDCALFTGLGHKWFRASRRIDPQQCAPDQPCPLGGQGVMVDVTGLLRVDGRRCIDLEWGVTVIGNSSVLTVFMFHADGVDIPRQMRTYADLTRNSVLLVDRLRR